MKSTKTLLIVATLLVLLVNVFVLVGVAWNRSGSPESQLTLSERELQLPWYSRHAEENSGIALRLRWSALESEAVLYGSEYPAWLDKSKLSSLGFTDLQEDDARRHRRERPREVLLVLELAGPAYNAALQQAKEQLAQLRAEPTKKDELEDWEKHVTSLQNTSTRLYAVDAGLELGALRQRYPDRQKFLIVSALIGSNSWLHNDIYSPRGHIDDVPGKSINLPRDFHSTFESLRRNDWDHEIKFQIEVAFGKRLEPWIISTQVTSQP